MSSTKNDEPKDSQENFGQRVKMVLKKIKPGTHGSKCTTYHDWLNHCKWSTGGIRWHIY